MLEQSARILANGCLQSHAPTSTLPPYLLACLSRWMSSPDLALRTQAHRAVLNNSALSSHGSGGARRGPQYGDMLWPVYDNTVMTGGAFNSTMPAPSPSLDSPPSSLSAASTSTVTSASASESASVSAPAPASSASAPREVDIVLVHGLMGGPLLTWRTGAAPVPASSKLAPTLPKPTAAATTSTAPSARESSTTPVATVNEGVIGGGGQSSLRMWPVEWLTRDLAAAGVSSRVVSVEYNGNLFSGLHAHPPRDLDSLATVLLKQLQAARTCTHDKRLCVCRNHPPDLSSDCVRLLRVCACVCLCGCRRWPRPPGCVPCTLSWWLVSQTGTTVHAGVFVHALDWMSMACMTAP
jgi:hypothetical protein